MNPGATRKRLALIALAATAAVAAAVVVFALQASSSSASTPSPSPSPTVATPDWLMSRALAKTAECHDPDPTRIDWGLIDPAAFESLMQGAPASAFPPTGDCWAVVLHGTFRYGQVRTCVVKEGTDPVITGGVIWLLIDPETRQTAEFGIGGSPGSARPDFTSLAGMHSTSLLPD
jgi:hypothetical protein